MDPSFPVPAEEFKLSTKTLDAGVYEMNDMKTNSTVDLVEKDQPKNGKSLYVCKSILSK